MLGRKRLKVGKIISWQPILNDEYLRLDFKLEPFIVANIQDAKKTSLLIKRLSETYPLSSSLKYKRVRCDKQPQSEENTLQVIISEKRCFKGLSSELEAIISGHREVELPIDRVYTRKQYDIVSKYWPLQFHPDKRIESLADLSFEKLDESLMLRSDFYARLTLDLAQHYKSTSAAIIVDARRDRVVASGAVSYQ